MNAVNEYLRICHTYCNFFGGLRWSHSEDTVDHADGATFVFAEEIAQFLEGFARERVIHFAHILHLLSFLRSSRAGNIEIDRLRGIYRGAKGTLRNAGTFFALLCEDIPEVPES